MKNQKRKALVIDDDPGVRSYISEILVMEDFDVWEAYDGTVGIELIEATKDFDLIVTDILMPNQDGIEVLISLRNTSQRSSPKAKVIVISGGGPHLDPSSFLEDTKGLGADALIMKPFSIDGFRATLSSLGFSVRLLQPSVRDRTSDEPASFEDVAALSSE